MVIVRLNGGLGNQMFEYAMARTVAHRRHTSVRLDFRVLEADRQRCYGLDAWNVNAQPASRFELFRVQLAMRVHRAMRPSAPYYERPIVYEKSHRFDGDALKARRDCLLAGYWQSEKYFNEIESTIRAEFTLRAKPAAKTEMIADAIRYQSNSVFLHVRRGDLVADPVTSRLHGSCSLAYYQDAVSHVARSVDRPHFFVFSDEPEWVRENIGLPFPMTIVDHNRVGNSRSPGSEHEDLWLMTLCRHGILSNSSFSWWGAWLNPVRERVVIAPKQWVNELDLDLRDLIPEAWIRM